MKNEQKKFAKIIASLFVFFALTFFAASWYVHEVQSDYVSETKLKLAEQETRLAALSEIIDRDGADAVVERIVQDCSPENRARFDYLLGTLSQLRYTELIEVKQLFDACGNFFAQRKAVMVARLEREFEVYIDHIDVLELIEERPLEVLQKKEEWESVVSFEKRRSELSLELVTIQGEIIEALLNGVSVSSEEMQQMLERAQTTKDTLIYLNTQIDDIRYDITSI